MIAQVFLVAFMFLKVSGLHVFMHHHADDTAKCVLCHLSSRDNATPLLLSDNAVDFEVNTDICFPEVDSLYQTVTIYKFKTHRLVSRPPPFYTVTSFI